MRTPSSLLIAAAALAVLACAGQLRGHDAGASGAPQLLAIALPQVIAAPLPTTAARPPQRRHAAAGARAPVAASAPPDAVLSTRVDRLSRSADPVDAFAAYKLVTDCLWARDHEHWLASHVAPADRAQLPDTAQACGDIASDQIQGRLRWLERAALAGVHHAATALAHEGPDGQGLPADAELDAPANADWKQRVEAAYDAGVHTCDPESLDHRVSSYETGTGVGQDRAKALTYWVAYLDCRKRLDATPAAILGNGDNLTRSRGGTLSAEQIAAAVTAGQQMARDAKPLPGDS